MRLVLDSNEYIFAFGLEPRVTCIRLLEFLEGNAGWDIRIVRTIVNEVAGRTPEQAVKGFYAVLEHLLEDGCGVDEDFVVPHHIAQHYQDVGFKEADAHIAAYAQGIGTDMVLSENRRHFHDMARQLPFQVMDAEQFLKRHAAGR